MRNAGLDEAQAEIKIVGININNLRYADDTTGLENVSFNSNPKERQCQRMLKLPHNCTHLTC